MPLPVPWRDTQCAAALLQPFSFILYDVTLKRSSLVVAKLIWYVLVALNGPVSVRSGGSAVLNLPLWRSSQLPPADFTAIQVPGKY